MFRILKGKLSGVEGGEQASLSFEEFPHVALSKTYCVDSIVADSACSSTAYLGGVKGNYATLGLSGAGRYKQCETQLETENHVSTIMEWAQAAGKATGVITTNGITDASPAGSYAKVCPFYQMGQRKDDYPQGFLELKLWACCKDFCNHWLCVFCHYLYLYQVAYRGWYNDWEVADDGADPDLCDDIAEQLVRRDPGRNITVLMGGGREDFYNETVEDVENLGHFGHRTDGVDLIQEWSRDRVARGATYKFMTSGDS